MLAIFLQPFATNIPHTIPWPIENFFGQSIRKDAQNNQMLWLASKCYTPVALCRLDLNFSTILTDGIMAWVRVWIQIKPIRVGSKYFSKTSDKMAIRRKFFIFGRKQ